MKNAVNAQSVEYLPFKLASFEDEDFFIRRKKKPKFEKPEGLKLILKVGGNSSTSTPEHYFDNTPAGIPAAEPVEDTFNSPSPTIQFDSFNKVHKKSKKKKKKKEKDHDKREKKKKHRKEKKKRCREESSQEDAQGDEIEELTTSNCYFSGRGDVKNELIGSTDSSGRQRKSEKSALQQLLEYVHQIVEKKDTQQFFAWPVTDQIAPGYSLVISRPMDLNSMKRNIENHIYSSLPQYIDDFQLMCRNAMVYNRPDTIYYKAAKKLLHSVQKTVTPDKLRSSLQLLPLLSELSSEQLGFDMDSSATPSEDEENVPSNMECHNAAVCEQKCQSDFPDDVTVQPTSICKNETMSEDSNPDEILAQAKNAAKRVADKLSQKKPSMEMGFLRQKEDGSTTLAILISNDGIDKKTKERPVLLGSLIGKLSHGSGNVQGFREDKRNFIKPVKPLYYGAFGSYAPSYDSTFANLTREESQLLFRTYGDEAALQYAESILNFSKDCDYVTTMVDNVLDIMTGGDHRKTKRILEEKKMIREEEEADEKRLKHMIDSKKGSSTAVIPTISCSSVSSSCNGAVISATTAIKSATVNPISKSAGSDDSKIEFNQLKSLSEYGIDTTFIDYYENVWKEEQKLSDKLEQTRSLLERLHQTQYERLSAPLPQHLAQISPVSEAEHVLADKVTENLTTIIKKVSPGNIAPVTGIRKAMGIAPIPPQQTSSNSYSPHFNYQVLNNNDELPSNVNSSHFSLHSSTSLPKQEDENVSNVNTTSNPVTGFDLESELREFLESDSALSSFHLPDDVDDTDKTIEQMLSAHS